MGTRMDHSYLPDEFFLIAHDEFSGKLRISQDLLGCGLVGAQLADLVMARRIGIEAGRVLITDTPGDAGDEVGAYVIETLTRQTSTHSVRVWIETFADVLYELVGRRLIAAGVVRRESGGRQLCGSGRIGSRPLICWPLRAQGCVSSTCSAVLRSSTCRARWLPCSSTPWAPSRCSIPSWTGPRYVSCARGSKPTCRFTCAHSRGRSGRGGGRLADDPAVVRSRS